MQAWMEISESPFPKSTTARKEAAGSRGPAVHRDTRERSQLTAP